MVAREVEREARRLRRAIERLGQRGRTERIPRWIREQVVELVGRSQSAGMSRRKLAVELGLAVTTVTRWWVTAARSPRTLVPVRVELERKLPVVGNGRGLVLVSDNGLRLEGLGVSEAIEVLRALG